MSEGLYQKAIVELARAATGAGTLDRPTASATVDNPLCGDRASVDMTLDGERRIVGFAHRIRGCLLCQASASALGQAAPGATPEDLRAASQAVDAMLKGGRPAPGGRFAAFAAFLPVVGHRSRHDCVRLPLQAVEKCLTDSGNIPRRS